MILCYSIENQYKNSIKLLCRHETHLVNKICPSAFILESAGSKFEKWTQIYRPFVATLALLASMKHTLCFSLKKTAWKFNCANPCYEARDKACGTLQKIPFFFLFSKIRNYFLKMSNFEKKVPNFREKDRFVLTIFTSVVDNN